MEQSFEVVQNRVLASPVSPQARVDTVGEVGPLVELAAASPSGFPRDTGGSTGSAELDNEASDSNLKGNEEGPTKCQPGPSAISSTNTSGASNSQSTAPPAGVIMDDSSVAAAVKRSQRAATLKARLAQAQAVDSATQGTTGTIKIKPRSKRQGQPTQNKKHGTDLPRSKSAGPGAPPSRKAPKTRKAPKISVDTSALVKQSLIEHYWEPVKVKMVTWSIQKSAIKTHWIKQFPGI